MTCALPRLAAPRPRRASALALTALAAVSLSACGGSVPVEFDVPLETETTVEGAGILGQALNLTGFSGFSGFELSSRQEFENNNANKENVTDVRLTTLQLEVVSPADGDLDFLNEIHFYAEAPGEERIHVAGGTIDDGLTEVELPIDDVNLAPYVKADSMTLDTEASGEAPEDDTTIRATANFHVTAEVDAQLLGQLASES